LGEPFSHSSCVCQGLFSPDGKSVLIGHEDGSVWLWDLATRQLLIQPLRAHQGPIWGLLAFSRDGKTIATGGQDSTLRLWDVATGQPIGPIQRLARPLRSTEILADGKTLFTGSRLSPPFPGPVDLPDDLDRVATWVEVITGLRLDKRQGRVEVL